ncbi:MAG: hypothetical protein GYB66_14470 [Chloroflexi bacterium]|nr:hypothetical protein [Chloroflexota bacterium]
MNERLLRLLPDWAHPRFPLVAKELRDYRWLDQRLTRFSRRAQQILAGISGLFAFSLVIVILSGGRLFGFLLLPIVALFAPPVIVFSELLFIWIVIGLPAKTSQMIAGEVESGTWNILLSTPLPRYQIFFSKMAALFWHAEPSLALIVSYRLLLSVFLLVERITLGEQYPSLTSLLGSIALIGLIALLPALELFAFSALGLLVSSVTSSTRNAILFSWGAIGCYRLITATLFLLLYLAVTPVALLSLGLLATVPAWMLLLLWLLLPDPGNIIGYSLSLGAVYVLLPIATGLLIPLLLVYASKHRAQP